MEFNSVNNININTLANQKANMVQNSQNQQPQPQTQTQAQTTPQQQVQYVNPALMYDFQSAKMDNETVLKYLQNLMKLPNSIDKFVNQLNSKNIDSKIASILVENMISTKALSEFLNKNSQEAISKLMQTISSTLKSGGSDISQLKEILSILGAIQNSTTVNTNTIKELLLLYIPLNAPVFDKEVDFDDFEDIQEENSKKGAKISILFETINFSNMLCTINENSSDLLIDIWSDKIFPKEKFISVINALSKEALINPLIEFKNRQTSSRSYSKQNFKVLSDGFISSTALILSHLIIKIIFKIDNDYSVI